MSRENIEIRISAATREAEVAIERMATQASQEIAAMAAAARGGLDSAGKAMESLGIRSGKVIADEARKARDAYRSMVASGASEADLARAEGALKAHFARLRAEMDKFKTSGKAESPVAEPADSAASALARIGHYGSMLIAGNVVIGWARSAASALVEARVAADRFKAGMQFSAGEGGNVTAEIAYVKEAAHRLGIELDGTAKSYVKIKAAASEAGIPVATTRQIFESVAKAATVMGLSAEETNGAFLAIGQMMSKGTVQAEEFKLQLAERLPMATGVAARALGVTTAEFMEMMAQGKIVASDFLPLFAKALEESLGDAPNSAAKSAQAQLNRLSSAWMEFKQNLGDAGYADTALQTLQGLTTAMKDASQAMEEARRRGWGSMGQNFAAVGGFLYGHQTPEEEKRAILGRIAAINGQADGISRGSPNAMEQEQLRSLQRERDQLKARLFVLAGRGSFELPDLKATAAEALGKQQAQNLALHKKWLERVASADPQAKKKQEIASYESEFAALKDINPSAYAQGLAAVKAKGDGRKAEDPLARLKLEARAQEAGLAPDTVAEIDKLNAALAARNITVSEYNRLLGVSLDNDRVLNQEEKEKERLLKQTKSAQDAMAQSVHGLALAYEQRNQKAGEALMSQQERELAESLRQVAERAQQARDSLSQKAASMEDNAEAQAAYLEKLAEVNAAEAAQIERERQNHAERMARNADWKTGAIQAMNDYQARAANAADSAKEAFTRGFAAMEDSLVQFAMTGKLNFSNLANSMISEIVRVQMRAAAAPITAGIGDWIKGLFGGGGQSASEAAVAADINSAGLGEFAKGGAFDGVQTFAKGGAFTNSIVNSPTLFKFANGSKFGLMGEAGPEAVMPLARDGQGRLGVRTQGAASPVINVNIIGAPSQPKVEQTPNGSGGFDLRIMFEQVESYLGSRIGKGDGLARLMEGRYALNPAAGTWR